jgi:hypothetical protein
MAELTDERVRELLARASIHSDPDNWHIAAALRELLERRALAEARQPAGEAVERKSVTISGAIDEYLSHPEHRTAEMPSRQPSVRMAQAERLVEYEAGQRAGEVEEMAIYKAGFTAGRRVGIEAVARVICRTAGRDPDASTGPRLWDAFAGKEPEVKMWELEVEYARAVLALPRIAAALEWAEALADWNDHINSIGYGRTDQHKAIRLKLAEEAYRATLEKRKD